MRNIIALLSGHTEIRRNGFSPIHFSSSLKQQALLFDIIGISGLATSLEYMKQWKDIAILDKQKNAMQSSLIEEFESELYWLKSNKIVLDLESEDDELKLPHKIPGTTEFYPKYINLLQQSAEIARHMVNRMIVERDLVTRKQEELYKKRRQHRQEHSEWAKNELGWIDKPKGMELNEILATASERITKDIKILKLEQQKESQEIFDRFLAQLDNLDVGDCIELRMSALLFENYYDNVYAIPFLPYSTYLISPPTSIKSDVAQIVINKLPMPDETTPWEKILDYRNDSEVQIDLNSLRRWINKISIENLSPNEIEWLINQFERHMKLHRIKSNTETLEVIIKAPLEILEDLIKFKWSKIPNLFFAIKKREISLMEAELNAPGREIAYIIKARQVFPNTKE